MKVKEYVERRRAGTTMLELHKILTQEANADLNIGINRDTVMHRYKEKGRLIAERINADLGENIIPLTWWQDNAKPITRVYKPDGDVEVVNEWL